MLESSRGMVVRIVLGMGIVGGAGLYACSDSSPQSGTPGPVSEDPSGETIGGEDGGASDGGTTPSIDMAMPNSPMEIAGTEAAVSDKYWPLGVDLGEIHARSVSV